MGHRRESLRIALHAEIAASQASPPPSPSAGSTRLVQRHHRLLLRLPLPVRYAARGSYSQAATQCHCAAQRGGLQAQIRPGSPTRGPVVHSCRWRPRSAGSRGPTPVNPGDMTPQRRPTSRRPCRPPACAIGKRAAFGQPRHCCCCTNRRRKHGAGGRHSISCRLPARCARVGLAHLQEPLNLRARDFARVLGLKGKSTGVERKLRTQTLPRQHWKRSVSLRRQAGRRRARGPVNFGARGRNRQRHLAEGGVSSCKKGRGT